MPEIRSTDHADEPAPTLNSLPPRPCALNRPDLRAGRCGTEALRQSPAARAIRPIRCDCEVRARLLRPPPFPGRPSRGSNLFSLSAIREDMRPHPKRLKYLASERRKCAVPCVGKAAQSLRAAQAETDNLAKKRRADKDIAQFQRRAEIRFILPSLPYLCLMIPSSFQGFHQ